MQVDQGVVLVDLVEMVLALLVRAAARLQQRLLLSGLVLMRLRLTMQY